LAPRPPLSSIHRYLVKNLTWQGATPEPAKLLFVAKASGAGLCPQWLRIGVLTMPGHETPLPALTELDGVRLYASSHREYGQLAHATGSATQSATHFDE